MAPRMDMLFWHLRNCYRFEMFTSFNCSFMVHVAKIVLVGAIFVVSQEQGMLEKLPQGWFRLYGALQTRALAHSGGLFYGVDLGAGGSLMWVKKALNGRPIQCVFAIRFYCRFDVNVPHCKLLLLACWACRCVGFKCQAGRALNPYGVFLLFVFFFRFGADVSHCKLLRKSLLHGLKRKSLSFVIVSWAIKANAIEAENFFRSACPVFSRNR